MEATKDAPFADTAVKSDILATIPAQALKYDPEIEEIQNQANTIDAEDDTGASAVNIWRQLEGIAKDVVAFKVKTTLDFYHVGKLLLAYKDERKCQNEEQLMSALQLDLTLHAQRLQQKPDAYHVDTAMVHRALLCRKQGKEANALGCFGTWARTVNPTEAKKIIDRAADRPEKKKPGKKSAYERVLKMVREDISLQASLEALACECIYKLRDERRLVTVEATAAHGLALAEERKRHEVVTVK